MTSSPDRVDLSDAYCDIYQGMPTCLTNAGAYEWERHDCAVVALAICVDMPYSLSHEMCRKWGRRNKSATLVGSKFIQWLPFKFGKGGHCHKTLGVFVRHNPVGAYFVSLNNHAVAVVDGMVYSETPVSPLRRIRVAWKYRGISAKAVNFAVVD